MTIIKCKECGKDYSDLSEKCPDCSCPTLYNCSSQNNEADNVYDSELVNEELKNENDATKEKPIKLFGITGRISLFDYWKVNGAYLFLSLIIIIYAYSDVLNFNIYISLIIFAVNLISFVAMIPINIRRLHDTNRGGAYLLLGIVPIVFFYLLYLLMIRVGDEMANDYGSPCQIKSYKQKHLWIVSAIMIMLAIGFATLFIVEYNSIEINDNGTYSKKYTFENGDVYEGEWVSNVMEGQGTYTAENGEVWSGTWENNALTQGTFTYITGEIYAGKFENNMFNGQGTYTSNDGSTYSGIWKDDKLNGHAIINFSNGDKYDGNVKDLQMDGKGVYTYSSGEVLEGSFAKGEYLGY